MRQSFSTWVTHYNEAILPPRSPIIMRLFFPLGRSPIRMRPLFPLSTWVTHYNEAILPPGSPIIMRPFFPLGRSPIRMRPLFPFSTWVDWATHQLCFELKEIARWDLSLTQSKGQVARENTPAHPTTAPTLLSPRFQPFPFVFFYPSADQRAPHSAPNQQVLPTIFPLSAAHYPFHLHSQNQNTSSLYHPNIKKTKASSSLSFLLASPHHHQILPHGPTTSLNISQNRESQVVLGALLHIPNRQFFSKSCTRTQPSPTSTAASSSAPAAFANSQPPQPLEAGTSRNNNPVVRLVSVYTSSWSQSSLEKA
ncbi:hypothetical protein NC651_037837 [Populus alba x Populus x berolinensis]|nr:hypothetical protein NC651_037837 [Populus alba x Populus x berolinensis]